MTEGPSNEYLTLDQAAKRLRVPPSYLLHVLDAYGLTPTLRDTIGRPVTIRAADLRTIRRLVRDESHRGAA